MTFRTSFGETIFNQKYRLFPGETWAQRARTTADVVCGGLLAKDEVDEIANMIERFEFIPAGRYLYNTGRPAKYWNNCLALRLEDDTREEWASLIQRAVGALMTGAGIGVDYSRGRPEHAPLARTGGLASGPIALMEMVDEAGARVMQGGSRRSAMYGSLNWQHADAGTLLLRKNWDDQLVHGNVTMGDIVKANFNFKAPLSMTNVSLNYDDHILAYLNRGQMPEIFRKNVEQAMRTAEPGFSFNFGSKVNETLRNACTEMVSENDSDPCNLGSVNLSRIESVDRFREVVRLAEAFLLCGSIRSDVPYERVRTVREKNRRLGLGLMGIHEWLMKRGERYEVTPHLREWLGVYRDASDASAIEVADRLGVSRPIARRAVAPVGTIGILAGTTTGIEPLFAVAYLRRFLKGREWYAEYVVDGTAKIMIEEYGIDPDKIETALSLANDVERRIKFQADIQDYVDMAISSTINVPAWGTELNNPDRVGDNARIIAKYAPRLRGLTFYPDGSRGGQPLTAVPYSEAVAHAGSGATKVETTDVCELSGKGGPCGA